MLVMLHEKRKSQGTAGERGTAAGDADAAATAHDVGPTGREGEEVGYTLQSQIFY